jgi:hypothetical protein
MDDLSPDDSLAAVTGGSPVRQFAVFLPNRPGSFVSVLDLLRANHVVALGVSVQDSIDATVVRLVVSDPFTVETLFMEKGIPFNCMDVLVVALREGPEQMPRCLRELLNAETNIHFIYPLLTQPDGCSALVLGVEDADFGMAMLSKAGFRILFQEDLSR